MDYIIGSPKSYCIHLTYRVLLMLVLNRGSFIWNSNTLRARAFHMLSNCLAQGANENQLCFTDIRTFEILLRTYEVRDVALKSVTSEEACVGPLPQKRRMLTSPGENTGCTQRSSSILVRPCSTAKGHTGYLTFARLCV